MSSSSAESLDRPTLIGGKRDSHGCLTPAGYSWDEKCKVCIRPWETHNHSNSNTEEKEKKMTFPTPGKNK